MAVRHLLGRVRRVAAVAALLATAAGLPAHAASLECSGNDYIFGRNVASRTVLISTDEKKLVRELDGKPCDRTATKPGDPSCIADYRLDGALAVARVAYYPETGQAILYAFPPSAAPKNTVPVTGAIAMFKGLCYTS